MAIIVNEDRTKLTIEPNSKLCNNYEALWNPDFYESEEVNYAYVRNMDRIVIDISNTLNNAVVSIDYEEYPYTESWTFPFRFKWYDTEIEESIDVSISTYSSAFASPSIALTFQNNSLQFDRIDNQECLSLALQTYDGIGMTLDNDYSDTTFTLFEPNNVTGSEPPEQSKYISNIEIGDTNYLIKDKEARENLDSKQDTLVSGTNIKTIGGNSLLGSGDIEVGTDIPNMTLAEYNALPEHDPEQYYAITDDTDTGTDILQMIYPVGSVYETSNPTCPLANLFGTWVQEPNIVNDNFIIETYNDGSNGYRIWNDGWCEQWGYRNYSSISGNVMYVNLFKSYINGRFNREMVVSLGVSDTGYYTVRCIDSTENKRIPYYMYLNGAITTNNPLVVWKASGYLATDQYTHINVPTYNKFRRIA